MDAPYYTLADLKRFEAEANTHAHKAKRATDLAERLAGIRNGDRPLMVAYKAIHSYESELQSAIEAVLNECGPELLRIAEMRQTAFARSESAKAAMVRAQLATVVAMEAAP